MKESVFDPSLLSFPSSYDGDSVLAYLLSSHTEVKKEYSLSVQAGSSLTLTIVDFSSRGIDRTLNISLAEEAQVNVSLASLLCGQEDKIFHVNVTHEGRKSFSLTKRIGINSGSGHLSFLGASMIVNGAKGSSTRQEGRITNLSPEAKSEVSPSLLIKENDVRASHGATVGAYDPRQLFYLMSRGLSVKEAKKLITFGYFEPILSLLGDKDQIQEAKNRLREVSL